MSWTLNVPATPKDDFQAAVDAAVAGGQPLDVPEVAEAVNHAKGVMKQLGVLISRPKIGGSATGHVLIEGQSGPTWYEGITVSVSGSE